MTGMDRFESKQKRAMRRRNHIALDLANRKYHQRVKSKIREDYENFTEKDWLDFFEEED